VTLQFSTPTLVAFLLALVRSSAWVAVAPPFSTRTIPPLIKALIAAALALPVTPRLSLTVPRLGVTEIVAHAILQATIGAALGFVTLLLFAAIQAAGDLLDVFGGFSAGYAFDPLSNSQNSVFGRFYGLLATVLLFALDAHLTIVRGFLSSYEMLPLGRGLPVAHLAEILVHNLGVFAVAALQIAGPMLGVLFLADASLAMLTRISPALNAFSLSFPAKILLTLTIAGLSLPVLPNAVRQLTDTIARSLLAVAGGGG
jgi:flagellar biosynthesis protein FliR